MKKFRTANEAADRIKKLEQRLGDLKAMDPGAVRDRKMAIIERELAQAREAHSQLSREEREEYERMVSDSYGLDGV